jgi:hypothetical protein
MLQRPQRERLILDRINRAAPGRPLPDRGEEANEPRNVRPRIAPSVDSSLQGVSPRPASTSTSFPPMQPSARILAGRASSPFIGAQAASPAFPASLGAAPNSPGNSADLFQRWLATAAPSRGESAVASQNTSELLRGFDSNLNALPSLGSPVRASPSSSPVNEEVRSARLAMPREAAVQWYRNRMEDLLLVEHVYPECSKAAGQNHRAMERDRAALFSFAVSLSQADPHDRLGRFVLRYGSTDTDVSESAREQVDAFIESQAERFAGQGLRDALDLLCAIPTDERDAMCHQDGMTEDDVSPHHRRWLLPAPERALLEPLGKDESKHLSQFSAALLRGGHGGVSEWLAMFDDGRERLARQLQTRHIGSQPGSRRLAYVLDRMQEQAGIPTARRLRVEGHRDTFVGEHRPSQATEMRQPAAAVEPAHGEMPAHDTHEDNLEMIEVFTMAAETLMLAPRTIAKYGLALARFAKEMLADNPHADLRGFLQRYESSDEDVKSRALADRDRVIGRWGDDQRRYLNTALNLLIIVPPEERHLPEDSTRSQVRPNQLLERLPPDDRQLLQQLRNDSEQRGPARQGLRDAGLLIRFGAALVKKGHGGLSGWLAMHGDARHADAKQLFEAHLAGINPSARRHLPAAVARLQRFAGTQNSDRIRGHAGRDVPRANSGYAPDFPQAEAKSIDAAIAAKKGILQATTLANYRGHLIHFSTWLRQQRTHDSPAYPGGLQDILEIDRRGELQEVQGLRDQYLRESGGADGPHRDLKAALKVLLGHHRGQPLQEGQPATPQPSLPTVSLDLNNLPDPDWFDSPDLDSLSSFQHSVEVQSTQWPDHTQPVPASPRVFAVCTRVAGSARDTDAGLTSNERSQLRSDVPAIPRRSC